MGNSRPILSRISTAYRAALLLLLTACGASERSPATLDYFPMERGVKWTYATHCEDNDLEAPIDLVVVAEVLDVVDRGDVVAAVVQGFPLGISGWNCESIGEHENTVILRVAPLQYFHQGRDVLSRLQDPSDLLIDLVKEYEHIIDGPLAPGKRFGDSESMTRSDHMYCWYVESEQDVFLSGIRGVSPIQKHHVYHLVYRTNPDVLRFTFAPGIGIVEYSYHHNGTLSEVRMRLIEFERP